MMNAELRKLCLGYCQESLKLNSLVLFGHFRPGFFFFEILKLLLHRNDMKLKDLYCSRYMSTQKNCGLDWKKLNVVKQ